jgi:hypothetical protein
MFSFSNVDEKDINGFMNAKIQKLPPVFNTDNILEWSLNKDKRYLKLADSFVKFSIEIPENYVLDNDVFAKLVMNIELVINHENITFKSSPVDNPISSFLLNKATYGKRLKSSALKYFKLCFVNFNIFFIR